MGCPHDSTINGMTSNFFGSGSDALESDGRRKFFSNMEMVFFFVVATRLSCIIVGFWSLKGIFKTWQQALHFLQSQKLVVLLVEM